MLFGWDDRKNSVNQKKHNISFETAMFVFEDQFLLTEYDGRYDYTEERWQSIGSIRETLIYIGHTIEDFYEEEIIRIISTRKACPGEARRYSIHRQNARRITGIERH